MFNLTDKNNCKNNRTLYLFFLSFKMNTLLTTTVKKKRSQYLQYDGILIFFLFYPRFSADLIIWKIGTNAMELDN